MSGWGEMAADMARAEFLARWVPLDDAHLEACPEDFRAQYRYTLARARAAESQLAAIQRALSTLKNAI